MDKQEKDQVFEDLRAAAYDIQVIDTLRRNAVKRRDAAMVLLLESGVFARHIAVAGNVSEGRVHQVRTAGAGADEGSYNGRPALFHVDEDGEIRSAYVLYEDEDGFSVQEEAM